MTLDDIAAEMRKRFTDSKGSPVMLAAEEWTVLADAIYLRDALVASHQQPDAPDTKAKVQKMLARHGRV